MYRLLLWWFYDNCFWDCIYCIYMCSTWALRFTYLLPFSLWCWDCGFWLLWSHERLPLGDSFTHGFYPSLMCWLVFVTHVFSCQSVLFWIMLMGASSWNTSVFILPTVNKKSARVNWIAPHVLPSGKDVVGIVLPLKISTEANSRWILTGLMLPSSVRGGYCSFCISSPKELYFEL